MDCRTSSNDISSRWLLSANDIPDSSWNSLFGGNVIKRKEFLLATEQAGFEEIQMEYLVIEKEETIVSIVPCFLYTIDLLNLVSAKGPSKTFRRLRKLFPNLLKVKSLMTGTYAASCEPFITMLKGLPDDENQKIRDLIDNELKVKHSKSGSKFIFVKDARENSIEEVKKILPDDFTYIISFPTSLIPILPEYPYPSALRTKSKQRIRNIERKFDERFEWEIVTDFSTLSKEWVERYSNVLRKAANKFEFLNEPFFQSINRLYGDSSFMLIARDRITKEIRLMTLILEDETRLVPLYLGISYQDDDTRVLYLSNIFRIVREAEKRGREIIEFGQTSYYPKVLSGAMVENVYYGFWSDRPFYKFLIKKVFCKIFAPPGIPGNAYRPAIYQRAIAALTNYGIKPRLK